MPRSWMMPWASRSALKVRLVPGRTLLAVHQAPHSLQSALDITCNVRVEQAAVFDELGQVVVVHAVGDVAAATLSGGSSEPKRWYSTQPATAHASTAGRSLASRSSSPPCSHPRKLWSKGTTRRRAQSAWSSAGTFGRWFVIRNGWCEGVNSM